MNQTPDVNPELEAAAPQPTQNGEGIPAGRTPAEWFWADWALVGVLVVFALALFGRSTGGIVYPDKSSQVMVEQLGILPSVSPLSPIWTAVIRFFANFGRASGLAFRLHLAGRLFAAGSALLIYRVVFGAMRGLLLPAGITRGFGLAMGVVLRLCAFTSSLLLFCLPVCHAAAAPHSAIFTVFMAALSGLAAILFVERRTLAMLILYAATAAFACLDSPGSMLLLPWWMVIVFMSPEEETQDGTFVGCRVGNHVILSGWTSVIWIAVFVLLFGIGFVLTAKGFAHSPGADFVRLRDFGEEMKFLFRRYMSELRQIYPSGGYLLVFLGVLAPAALAVTLSPGFYSERHNIWHVLLYTVIGIVAVSQAIPESKTCLWVYIPSSTMRAGTCVLGALSYSFALGFFLVTAVREVFPAIITVKPGGRELGAALGVERPLLTFLHGCFFLILSVLMLGCVLFGSVRLRTLSDAKPLRIIHDYLYELTDSIDSHPWVVTDRAFDAALRLVAKQRGTQAMPLPFALQRDSVERRIIAAKFENPLDRDDFSIGTGTLLREWSRHAPEKLERVSVLTAPPVWYTTGYKLIPSGLVLVPVPESTPVDIDALLAEQRPIWERWKDRVRDVRPENPILRPLMRAILRQLSLTATEFGNLCQEAGRPEAAMEAYSAARELDSLNLVARYNLQTLLAPEDDRAEALMTEVSDLRSVFDAVPIGVLMSLQGRIYSDAVRQRVAMNEIIRTEMRMSAGAFLSQLQETSTDLRVATYRSAAAVGAAFLRRREWDNARKEYESILAEAPNFVPALYGMAVLSAHSMRNADAADPWLQRLRDAGVGEEPVTVFKGMLYKELGEPRKLQQLLAPLVSANQENQDIWLLWGWAAVQLGNDAARRMAYWHLTSTAGARKMELYTAFREGNLHLVALKQRALLEMAPSDTTLRKAAMGAAWAEADLGTAKRLARSVLEEDDRHAPAHFVVGMAFVLEGKPELARTHLLRAEEYGLATYPLYNNLGMVCMELGDLETAHRYAMLALEKAPTSPEVVDTVVAIEIAQKRFDEAKAHLTAGLEANPGNKILRKRMRKIPGFEILR